MSKAIIQLCIYFCVLGFVVHAQTPDEVVPKEAAAQLSVVLGQLKDYEAKQKNLEAQINQVIKERESIEATTPGVFRTTFASIVGDKTINFEQVARNREEIRKRNIEEIKLQNELDNMRQLVLTNRLTLQDLKTLRAPATK